MTITNTYAPEEVQVIINGVRVTGFTDGTYVTVSRLEDTFGDPMVGSDGEATRVKNANKAGNITLTLKQSSQFNNLLSAFQITDEESGKGTFAIMVKDSEGFSNYSCATAYVKKQPDASFSNDLEDREWGISCPRLNMFTGGNPDDGLDPSIEAALSVVNSLR